jgi:hypothetical protein
MCASTLSAQRSRRLFPNNFVFGALWVLVIFLMLDLGVSGAEMDTEATAEASALQVSENFLPSKRQGLQ